MSGASAPPPASLTMDAFLQLADFIKSPEYIDRVREFQKAQAGHDAAAKDAADAKQVADEAQAKLNADRAQHASDVSDFRTYKEDTENKLATRAADLTSRENALRARQQAHAVAVADHHEAATKSTAALASRKAELDKLAETLDTSRKDAERKHADLTRRLAKIKEAAL